MNHNTPDNRTTRQSVRLSFFGFLASWSIVFGLLFLNAASLSVVWGLEPEFEPSGFVELLNGENLDGWKSGEDSNAFVVEDGLLKVHGKHSYLFYEGAVNEHDWKDFHAQIVIQTKTKAAGGIYFHTEFEKEKDPPKGYKCQIANGHPDPQKTGSLYGISSESAIMVEDNDWFILDIYVRDRRVVTMINGRWSVNWLESKEYTPPQGHEGRRLGRGTFAIEARDLNSTVLIKSFRVRPLK